MWPSSGANIERDAKIRVAEIGTANAAAMQSLEDNLAEVSKRLDEAMAAMKDAKEVEPKAEPESVKPTAQPMNLTVAVSVDAKKDETKKTITIKTGCRRNITGADVTPEENPEKGAE